MATNGERYCLTHPLTRLVCPRCIAAKGGKATAHKYSHETLARWGRSGGRPTGKKPKRKSPKKKSD